MKLGKIILYKAILGGAFFAGYYVNSTDSNDVRDYLRNNPQDRKEVFLETRRYIDPQVLDSLRQKEITKEDIYRLSKKEMESIWEDTKNAGVKIKDKTKEKSKSLLDKIGDAWDELKKWLLDFVLII